ncbi:MAG: D-2-hydroxyacid dehydrogenase [Chloroflexota bacterium]|nr:D-2-hydroxyacid dehydrogenase [Chloroflexota bacterium]
MKLLLAAREGADHFHLVEQLDLPDLEIARAETPEEIVAAIADADVFYGVATAAVVQAAPKLRWIQSPSAGVEYVARVPELVESDVFLTNTRGAHGPSIGEHTFALLLALTRRIPECLDLQRQHKWGRVELYRTSREIKDSTMGILGYGAIGRGVAQRATAFEMNLLAVDAQAVNGEPFLDEVWPLSRLPEMLERSDVVVVASPLTAESRDLIDAAMLARMRPDAYLIIVSRGGIVNEAALAAALHEGRLAGAGIDVTEVEPLAESSPLWDAPNTVITPHLAGDSFQKERRCVEILCDNLQRFSRGEELVNLVDKRRGY